MTQDEATQILIQAQEYKALSTQEKKTFPKFDFDFWKTTRNALVEGTYCALVTYGVWLVWNWCFTGGAAPKLTASQIVGSMIVLSYCMSAIQRLIRNNTRNPEMTSEQQLLRWQFAEIPNLLIRGAIYGGIYWLLHFWR